MCPPVECSPPSCDQCLSPTHLNAPSGTMCPRLLPETAPALPPTPLSLNVSHLLGTLCLASGQHSWNVYVNHVEDSNLFIGVSVGGHDLNADPQEMKHRTYYLSNG